MLRLFLIVLTTLPLAACATVETKPIQAASSPTYEVRNMPYSFVDDAEMVVTQKENFDKDGKPCPRFVHNVNAAEEAVDAVPKDYPHML